MQDRLSFNLLKYKYGGKEVAKEKKTQPKEYF